MVCKNPDECRDITNERYVRMEPHFSKAYDRMEQYRRALEEKRATMTFVPHETFRELDRAVSKRQVLEVIEQGEIIECHYFKKSREYIFLLSHFFKIGPGQYRPFHVPVVMKEDKPLHIELKSVYDPRTKKYKWNKSYSQRICVCESKQRN
ncbi:hypothetical protein [Paenibacillus sp. GP183]|jgi:hypothetical protein|uniref:hypothetical protein n=1 Tax=Paenibacillus sp. GP183 TaxID=1882751 RepID=UPI0008948DA0|nr:hypothetical protein [Paenibacillus sp. GP183]SED10664.1 hypothetical protein SAMN05443246_5733 [Paenibacillus sp. GP183]